LAPLRRRFRAIRHISAANFRHAFFADYQPLSRHLSFAAYAFRLRFSPMPSVSPVYFAFIFQLFRHTLSASGMPAAEPCHMSCYFATAAS